ncbi:glycosyltransferase, partial [Butyricicoccus intestinisimiae]|uniref:glycosyltransferase n=1 Tax=Butyricicoccus intestinisimiae TaxID=2841509 RepID=UPI003D914944
NRDLIQHQRGGYLVSANEVKQWQAAIKQGTDEESIWLKYGRYNQRRISYSFSFSTIHEKMGELYFSN